MFRQMLMLVCFGLATLLIGCADLVPSKPNGFRDVVQFCYSPEEGPDKGKLVVAVKNQGNATAPATTTNVEFFPGGVYSLNTPTIPAGITVNLPALGFPAGCFNPDCDFKITVDSKKQVDESNEGNNSADGRCIG